METRSGNDEEGGILEADQNQYRIIMPQSFVFQQFQVLPSLLLAILSVWHVIAQRHPISVANQFTHQFLEQRTFQLSKIALLGELAEGVVGLNNGQASSFPRLQHCLNQHGRHR
jgi:hypothetical protein